MQQEVIFTCETRPALFFITAGNETLVSPYENYTDEGKHPEANTGIKLARNNA